MLEKICCRILNQIPLIKYSKLGIIVRIQANKYISESEQINIVFDIYVDELVPTKSNIFFDISVNNGPGDLVLLTSESCCVVAKIPWSRNIGSTKRINNNIPNMNKGSSPSSGSSLQQGLKIKRPSHTYGFFDEEDLELFEDPSKQVSSSISASGDVYGQISSQVGADNAEKDIMFEIPLVLGTMLLNLGEAIQEEDKSSVCVRNGPCSIVKSSWYHLDEYIVFVLARFNKGSSKLIALDLASVVSSKEEETSLNTNSGLDTVSVENNQQKSSNLNHETSHDNYSFYKQNSFICNIFNLKFNKNIKGTDNTGIIIGSTVNIEEIENDPVDFAFGRGPDVWNMLTIYVLLESNLILAICPVVMNRMRLPYFAYEVLYTTLLEQEYLASSSEEILSRDFRYDEDLHHTLGVLLGDLRNPMDESMNIIEEVLHVDISRDVFLLISNKLKPVPVCLRVVWGLRGEDGLPEDTETKSLRFVSITNYPLSVFVIFGSNLEIGVFIASYLSLPNYKDTLNCNSMANSNAQEKNNRKDDVEDSFNFKLECIQRSKVPLESPASNSEKKSGQEDKEEEEETVKRFVSSLKFHDRLDFAANPKESNTTKRLNSHLNNEKPLFIVGVSTQRSFYVIYIDWLHYLFTLYSKIETELSEDEKDSLVLPISDNIEVIRKCISSNPQLKMHNIVSSSQKEEVSFQNTYLTFVSNYTRKKPNQECNKEFNKNIIYIEFIYTFINNLTNTDTDTDTGINKEGKYFLLYNPNYDELPEITSFQLYEMNLAKKEFDISNFIDLINEQDQVENEKAIIITSQLDYQVNKLNDYALERILEEMSNYTRQFKSLKDKIKSPPIQNEQEASEYYLGVLRFLNDYNSKVLIKLNNSTGPILNLVENITPRMKFMQELKDEIIDTNSKIKQRHEEIEEKATIALEMNHLIHQRILKIKNLFLQELNNHRIQYNQDVVLPELLLMLSNVQLELCSTLLNVFNHNTGTAGTTTNFYSSIKDNEQAVTDAIKLNTFSNEFCNYIDYNKSVIDNFQNLQNKILELNRIAHNFSN